MKHLLGTFAPFTIITLFTLILFFYLKEDGSKRVSRTNYNPNYNQNYNVEPKTNRGVQEIFRDVEVKKVSRNRVRYSSEVTSVRWSQHKGYERLVFDVDGFTEGSFQIGQDVNDRRILHGVLSGYKAFSATLPSFNSSSILHSMDVFAEGRDSYNFTLKLQRASTYKAFVLKNPTRIVIDFY